MKLVYGYLWYRKQRTKINFSYNFWSITRINFESTFTQLFFDRFFPCHGQYRYSNIGIASDTDDDKTYMSAGNTAEAIDSLR